MMCVSKMWPCVGDSARRPAAWPFGSSYATATWSPSAAMPSARADRRRSPRPASAPSSEMSARRRRRFPRTRPASTRREDRLRTPRSTEAADHSHARRRRRYRRRPARSSRPDRRRCHVEHRAAVGPHAPPYGSEPLALHAVAHRRPDRRPDARIAGVGRRVDDEARVAGRVHDEAPAALGTRPRVAPLDRRRVARRGREKR